MSSTLLIHAHCKTCHGTGYELETKDDVSKKALTTTIYFPCRKCGALIQGRAELGPPRGQKAAT